MNAQYFIKRLCPFGELDEYTVQEIVQFADRKIEERDKIKSQIARDLSRLGEMAFTDPKAYDKLKAKYRAVKSFGGNYKKIAILEQMKSTWCRE